MAAEQIQEWGQGRGLGLGLASAWEPSAFFGECLDGGGSCPDLPSRLKLDTSECRALQDMPSGRQGCHCPQNFQLKHSEVT